MTKGSSFKRCVLALGVLLVPASFAQAQDVRGQAMGGVLLPGGSLAQFNPAYSAYSNTSFQPDGLGGGLQLPLGLVSIFLRPNQNPITFLGNLNSGNTAALTDPNTGFDALAFLDQATHLNTFILNPPRSPREINLNISSTGIAITDENGRPIKVNYSSGSALRSSNGSGIEPVFSIPIRFGNFELGFSVLANVSGPDFVPDAAFRQALAGGSFQPNATYTLSGRANGLAGIGVNLAYATAIPLPAIPDVGDMTVYVGGRAQGFYGLAYADADVKLNATTTSSLQPIVSYEGTKIFYSTPATGGGYGGNLDVGAAVDVPVGADKSVATFGLGIVSVVNFGVWNGTEREYVNGNWVEKPASRNDATISPLFTVNAGYAFNVAELGTKVFVAADVQFGRGGFATHIGGEAKLGPVYARAGIGFENGLVLGAGAGLVFAPGFGLDFALTTHTAPWTDHLDFGIAAALRFGF